MSKEAMKMALGYMKQVLMAHDEKYFRHPSTEPERAAIVSDIEDVEEALANQSAQQENSDLYRKAFETWQEKTEWVQETAKPKELGMHRADVLRQRIEEAQQQEPVAKVGTIWHIDNGKATLTASILSALKAVPQAHHLPDFSPIFGNIKENT